VAPDNGDYATLRMLLKMKLAFLTSVSVSLTSLVLFSTVCVRGASIPRANDWQIAGPYGGSATAVAVDSQNPKVLLAGARQSLLYKSNDSGNSWTLLPFPKRAFGQVDAILIDPQDSERYLIALSGTSDAGLFVSPDGGKTWTASKTLSGFTVRSLAASASEPGRFVAGTTQGVYLSTDAGNTWSRISDPMNLEMLGITAVAIDPENPQVIYAGTTHLPWKTTDGGKTWESIHSGMINDSDVFSIFIDPRSPDRVFASACSGIYRSANRGDLWQKILGIPNTSRRTHVIRLDPSAPSTIYAGTTMGLFRSNDAGGTWRQLNGQQVNSLAFGPAKANMYLALEEGGLWKSNDQGQTLAPLNHGFVARRLTAVTSAGKRLFAIQASDGESTGLFTSDDAGETWERISNPVGLTGVHLENITGIPGSEQVLFAANSRQLFKSADGGRSWKPLPLIGTYKEKSKAVRVRTAKGRYITREQTVVRSLSPSAINSLTAIASGTQTVLFAASNRGLLRSTDNGIKWTFVNAGLLTPFRDVFVSPVNDGRLIGRSSSSLYFSNDFGDTWKAINFPLGTSQISAIAVPPANSSSRLLAATFRGLYSSKDDGQTWSIVNSGLPISTVESVIYSTTKPNVAYAVEFGQLYQSEDGGVQWTAESSTFRALRIRQLWQPAQLPDRLFAVTNDIGILFRNQAFIR
jgi:photosystem II stability/assembly factor-like uncharacterized protein